MRINVEQSALRSVRFKRLAMAVGRHPRHVWGDMLFIWEHCYEQRSPYVDEATLDAIADMEGFADAMLAEGNPELELARVVPPGTPVADPKGRAVANPEGRRTRLLWVCGVMDRIEYLLEQDARRELAIAAKRKKRDKALPMGRPVASAEEHPRPIASGSGSGSEISEHTHTRARANPPTEREVDPKAPVAYPEHAKDLRDTVLMAVWAAYRDAHARCRVALGSGGFGPGTDPYGPVGDDLKRAFAEMRAEGHDYTECQRRLVWCVQVAEAKAMRDRNMRMLQTAFEARDVKHALGVGDLAEVLDSRPSSMAIGPARQRREQHDARAGPKSGVGRAAPSPASEFTGEDRTKEF